MDLVATVLDGILLGGLYALFASGLSLIFGVMRLVNTAHGDLIVLSAFIALVVTDRLGVHPLVSLVLVVPFMALLGYGLQRGIFNRTLGSDILPSVLVSFGLTVLLQKRLAPDLQRRQPATAGRQTGNFAHRPAGRHGGRGCALPDVHCRACRNRRIAAALVPYRTRTRFSAPYPTTRKLHS